MFKISPAPLESVDFKKNLHALQAGAYSSFEGWVRDDNNGKAVVALEYEAYEALCQNEARKIFTETFEKFDILAAGCIHRSGKLQVGEMAVWIGVTAKHRDESFKACRYLIDEIKARLPIWKKEYYADGNSGWVACRHCAEPKLEENDKE